MATEAEYREVIENGVCATRDTYTRARVDGTDIYTTALYTYKGVTYSISTKNDDVVFCNRLD